MFFSSRQRTALHDAARNKWRDNAAVCELLIDAKADVNARDRCAFMFEV